MSRHLPAPLLWSLGLSSLLLLGWVPPAQPKPGAKRPAPSPAKPHPAEPQRDEAVSPQRIAELFQRLNQPELAARLPGSPAERDARALVAQELSTLKLLPGGTTAASANPAAPEPTSYQQQLLLPYLRTRIVPGGAPLFRSTSATVPVQVRLNATDLLLLAGEPQAVATLRELPVLFVGYGISAATLQWDDYKGADLHGKVVLLLEGAPPELAAAHHHASRWPEKFAQAAQRGAAAVFSIADSRQPAAERAEEPTLLRQRYGGEYLLDRSGLATSDGQPSSLLLRGFLSEEAGRRLLLAARLDLDELRQKAAQREFGPLSPGLQLSMAAAHESRPLESGNLIGLLPGSDPELQHEAVLLTAQLAGSGPLDGSAAVATLLAMAGAALSRGASPRTLIFAALGTPSEAELASRQLLLRLPTPVTRVIAHLHLGGVNPHGESPTVLQRGRGHSSLDGLLDAVAGELKRQVSVDPSLGAVLSGPGLAMAELGIPSLTIGARDDAATTVSPSDAAPPSLPFIGSAHDGDLLLRLSRKLAEGKTLPTFNPGDEFASP